jgi:5-methylcytosine-specific restriction endonuclease McrA
MKLIQTKRSELQSIRIDLLIKQDYRCKICGTQLSLLYPKNIHVDHQHFGDKLIRAVLCRRCNQLEGKLYNSYKRYTKREEKSDKDLMNVLKGLVKYQKVKPTKYIHPSANEKKKRRRK